MSKLLASEIKVDDFIEITASKLKGIVDRIYLHTKDQIYINLLTKDGMKGAYLKLTEEVVKDIAPVEFSIMKNLTNIRYLSKNIIKIGSDPEMFVVNKENEVIPSYLFLKSKEEKDAIEQAPIHGNTDNSSTGQPIFWDGFQAEFNLSASGCLSWMVDSAYHGLSALAKRAKKYDKNARLTIQPTMNIPPHYLAEGKNEHVQFGCMPSKNAYGMEGIKADGRDVLFRSAGGHTHFGLHSHQKGKVEEYVKALDAILGVACVSLFGNYDDVRRREYYGLAGEYRTPDHGLEYRTLSNVWMCHPVVTNIIFELSRNIITMVDKDLFKTWQATEEETIATINDCNLPLAVEILKRNKEVFKALISSISGRNSEKTTAIYNSFILGVENLIENPDDVEGNWNIGKTWQGHNEEHGKKIGNMQYLPLYSKILKEKV